MLKMFIIINVLIFLIACQSEKEKVNYYANGNIKYKWTLIDGLRDGKMYEYYENGDIKAISEWKQGKAHGEVIRYFSNGKTESISHWSDSLADDTTKYFYESGQLKSISFFNEGHLQGESLFYYPDGKLMEKQLYGDRGELIYFSKYAKTGEKRDEMIIPIIKPVKDTITFNEEFIGTVYFGLNLKGQIQVISGHFEGTSLVDTTQVLQQVENNVFKFSIKPQDYGVNTFAIFINHTTDKNDTLSVDGMIRKHSYFVKP